MNEKLQKAKELRKQGLTLEAIGRKLNISRVSVFNLLKRAKVDMLANKLEQLEKRIIKLEEKDKKNISSLKNENTYIPEKGSNTNISNTSRDEEKRDPALMDYDKNLGIFTG